MPRYNYFVPAALIIFGIIAASQLQGCAGVVAAGAAGGAALATDRRSGTAIVDDGAIELKINNAILADEELAEKLHINVTSYNHVVLLTGEAPTEAARNRIVDYARHAEKVRQVYNEIAVEQASDMNARSLDTWITAKVKAKLLGLKDISTAHIKVVTEKQIVFLMGIVTREEAQAAVDTARFVDNVERVVILFEYQN